jgi:hypothetical protein
LSKSSRPILAPTMILEKQKNKLATLKMLTGQHISKYIIHLNPLASCCNWGDSPLWDHFYDRLSNCLKDEISWGDGKPKTLHLMWKKA